MLKEKNQEIESRQLIIRRKDKELGSSRETVNFAANMIGQVANLATLFEEKMREAGTPMAPEDFGGLDCSKLLGDAKRLASVMTDPVAEDKRKKKGKAEKAAKKAEEGVAAEEEEDDGKKKTPKSG